MSSSVPGRGSGGVRVDGKDRRASFQIAFSRAGLRPSAADPGYSARVPPTKILIVEDDPHICRLLEAELGRLGYALRTAGTAADALALAKAWAPALMLLDLGLPDRDGTGVLRELRGRADALPVICLTARDQPHERVGGLRAGADDYIVKPFDVAELDARIRAVLRRASRDAAPDVVVGGLRLAGDGARVLAGEGSLGLTPSELHVLRQLMRNAGRVVTRAQLVQTLAARNEDIGDKSVEVYVHRVRGKIHGHGVEIVTVRGFGYLLRQAPDAAPGSAA